MHVLGIFHSRFQFHYGSIKIYYPHATIKDYIYFNSTMVRLKSSEKGIKDFDTSFQFHYGSIKINRLTLTKLIKKISIPLWFD